MTLRGESMDTIPLRWSPRQGCPLLPTVQRRWNIAIILSIISIIFGVMCVVDAFGMMEKAIMLVGFILLFNGVTNVWVALTSSRAETLYKKNETIDVEFNEDKEN